MHIVIGPLLDHISRNMETMDISEKIRPEKSSNLIAKQYPKKALERDFMVGYGEMWLT